MFFFIAAGCIALAYLALLAATVIRMRVTGPKVRAEIRARMAPFHYRPDGPHGPTAVIPTRNSHAARTDVTRSDRASSPTTPDSTQGATPSAKTTAAPCHPATVNGHEVHTA
ncbi:hypothetical protein GCM10023194_58750 [Planotetraspora phitsanulokensis]|uniref:Uncharacterized protein n=1 Tax=Planotetraspora phitsanulokensis TaxID=575192 RepID=A0A8J3UBJ7_9ACTN|nr:hypothetical protein [Planotetraspora phitsanulokensis]GII40336.1 hypothetical protein Pph01_53390 [Planotetraspora phitsanulokensis]